MNTRQEGELVKLSPHTVSAPRADDAQTQALTEPTGEKPYYIMLCYNISH